MTDAAYVVELYDQLQKQGIPIWLDGGWGIDALLGEQTRPHGDLDIVIEEKHLPKLRALLEAQGFKDIERDDTRAWNFVLGDDLGRQVDVHAIVFDAAGNGVYGPAENGTMYPASAFAATGAVNNFPVNCLSAAYQVESRTGYELRETDFKDVSALCERFGIPLPDGYATRPGSPPT